MGDLGGQTTYFGNTVQASRKLVTNRIECLNDTKPITVDCDVVIEGTLNTDDITLTGSDTIVGVSAGHQSTTLGNTFIGSGAGFVNTTGISNTFLGNIAGVANTSGTDNTFIGKSAGDSNTSGSENTLVGKEAGNSLTTGSSNTCVGHDAGGNMTSTLDGCVLIGNETGRTNTTADRLMIDNKNTTSPLIDGIFGATPSTSTLQVHGTTTLGSNGSFPIHRLNTTTDGAAGASLAFIVININGIDRKIQYFATA